MTALAVLLVTATACTAPSADAVASTNVPPSPAMATTAAVVTDGSATSQGTTTTAPLIAENRTEIVMGVVVAVDGDLVGVEAFSIVLDDGSTLVLTPEEGLLFDDSSPLSHLRDHMISGSPVLVEFHTVEDIPIASAVGDAE